MTRWLIKEDHTGRAFVVYAENHDDVWPIVVDYARANGLTLGPLRIEGIAPSLDTPSEIVGVRKAPGS